jgi:hypothetical protein
MSSRQDLCYHLHLFRLSKAYVSLSLLPYQRPRTDSSPNWSQTHHNHICISGIGISQRLQSKVHSNTWKIVFYCLACEWTMALTKQQTSFWHYTCKTTQTEHSIQRVIGEVHRILIKTLLLIIACVLIRMWTNFVVISNTVVEYKNICENEYHFSLRKKEIQKR